MAQIHEPPPGPPTARFVPPPPPGGFQPRRPQPSSGKTAAIVLMLVAVTILSASVGYLLAGGRLPDASVSPTPAPPTAVAKAPEPPMLIAPTLPPAPQPTNTAVPVPTAVAEKPAMSEVPPTVPPAATAPPPAPTAPPPTAAPVPAAKPANPAPVEKPGVLVPVRPGMDARQAQIEGRVDEYFAALSAQDYARAQQVCCTAEWRSRYPLERWERNFDGVTDLRQTNPPRYVQIADDAIVVDTDYTFLSGGARRNFTLRWTFKPVGSEWQAELAEAFPTE